MSQLIIWTCDFFYFLVTTEVIRWFCGREMVIKYIPLQVSSPHFQSHEVAAFPKFALAISAPPSFLLLSSFYSLNLDHAPPKTPVSTCAFLFSHTPNITMAPPLEVFPAKELPYYSQTNLKGTKRKGFDGDLKKCELKEMLQYECWVDEPVKTNSVVKCREVLRLFRK